MNSFCKKAVYTFRAVIVIAAIFCILGGLWLTAMSIISNNYKDSSVEVFPLILGGICLFNVFKFNKSIEINNGIIDSFHIKYHSIKLGRGIFISLAYAAFSVNFIKEFIILSCFAVFLFYIEWLLCKIELKKLKPNTTEKNYE